MAGSTKLTTLRRRVAGDLVHVATASAFAVAQPLFARLEERPHFLVDLDSTPLEIVLVAGLLSLGVPALLAALELLVRPLGEPARQATHVAIMFALLTGMALPIVKALILPGLLVGLLALGLAAGATWAYCRARPLRLLVMLASPGIVLFPALFVWNSPVAAFVWNRPILHLKARHPAPVVFLVFDEFTGLSLMDANREIDAERFPGFARLARTATWYRNATTVHPDTSHAVPALLAGKYPVPGPAPVAETLAQNLFSVISATEQYEAAIFEPVSRMAVARRGREKVSPGRATWQDVLEMCDTLARVYLRDLAPQELWPLLPPVRRLWFGEYEARAVPTDRRRGVFRNEWSARRDQQFEHLLACIDGAQAPVLYFQHLLLPHVPWCYLPGGQRYANDGGDWTMLNFDTHSQLTGVWSHDEWFITQCRQRYLLQLMYVDHLVGRLLDRLQEQDLFDRSLIVVTADHGASFRPNVSRRQPVPANLGEILSVPLFIKAPGQRLGTIDDRSAQSIDILPTVADLLGLVLPLPVDGRSLLAEQPSPAGVPRVMIGGNLVTVDPRVVRECDFPQDQARLFPPGRASLFAIGPHAALHGRLLRDLQLEQRVTTTARVSPPPPPLGDRPEDQVVPLMIEGEILGDPLVEPEQIAAAVDGQVVATTRTFIIDGLKNRFALLLPDFLATRSGLEVSLFRILAGHGPPRLEPMRIELRQEEIRALPVVQPRGGP